MNYDQREHRRAFSAWLRTGRWPSNEVAPNLERKFNPYHDPRNGRFTFAPGGPRSFQQATVSWRRQNLSARSSPAVVNGDTDQIAQAQTSGAVFRPGQDGAQVLQIAGARSSRTLRGGGLRPYDPLTLRQVFPGLRKSAAVEMVEAVHAFLGLADPANELVESLNNDLIKSLFRQLKSLDPKYHYDYIAPPDMVDQNNLIDALRLDRAILLLRLKGEWEPMQIEILRFVQRQADDAYEEAMTLLKAGKKLPVLGPKAMALGNFVDKRARDNLRTLFRLHGIEAAGKGAIRINRREYGGDITEAAFRIPDVRVGDVAIEVTTEKKTLEKTQVREFFQADFAPRFVIIVRPIQINSDSPYLIMRPGAPK